MARLRRTLGFAGLAATAAFIGAAVFSVPQANSADRASAAPMFATPFGITLQPLGIAQGWGLGKDVAATIPRDEIAYTDLEGMTLYTFDADPAGKSTCVGDCAKKWLPMPARANGLPGTCHRAPVVV